MADVELSQSPGPSDRVGPSRKQDLRLKAKALAEEEQGTSDGQSMAYIARFLAVTLLCLITLGVLSTGFGGSTVRHGLPIALGHAHNDEKHEVPLFGALAEGFCSIEADVYVINGTLVIGHDVEELNTSVTLQGMYLDPLAEIVAANGGLVYNASRYARLCDAVTMMVDVKQGGGAMDPNSSFVVLHAILSEYQARQPGLFTWWDSAGVKRHGALQVTITGNYPDPAFMIQHCGESMPRLATIDGHGDLINSTYPPSLVPTVNIRWCCRDIDITQFRPTSSSPTPEQAAFARDYVTRAHAAGRLLRFWNTNDTPETWQLMVDLCVDIVNVDNVVAFRSFVVSNLYQRRWRRTLGPFGLDLGRLPLYEWHITLLRSLWSSLPS